MLTLDRIMELLPRWEQFMRLNIGGTDTTYLEQLLDPETRASMLPEGIRNDPDAEKKLSGGALLMSRPDEEWIAGNEFLAENYGFGMSITDHAKIMAELLSFLDSPQIVVDVGCGPCSYLSFLLSEGVINPRRVVGLDPADGAMKRARKISKGAGVGIDLVRGFGQTLPLRDDCADFVFSVDTIHWSHQWRKCLSEMARITAPAGRLFISHTTGCPRTMGEINELKVTDILTKAGMNVRDVKHFMSEDSMTVRIVYAAAKEKQSGLIIPGRIA